MTRTLIQRKAKTQKIVDGQLVQLQIMSRNELLVLWKELFDRDPNPALRRDMLIPVLAYRIQEKAFGGLKKSSIRRLTEILENNTSNKTVQLRPKPGTRFVREHQGKLHEVTALGSGFEYENKNYRSLSEVANTITGSKWSGPLFFGLKRKPRTKTA